MTPDQALALLDQVTQGMNMNRQVHLQVMEALRILKGVLEKKSG